MLDVGVAHRAVIRDHLVVVATRIGPQDVAEVGATRLDRMTDDRLQHSIQVEARARYGADDLAERGQDVFWRRLGRRAALAGAVSHRARLRRAEPQPDIRALAMLEAEHPAIDVDAGPKRRVVDLVPHIVALIGKHG